MGDETGSACSEVTAPELVEGPDPRRRSRPLRYISFCAYPPRTIEIAGGGPNCLIFSLTISMRIHKTFASNIVRDKKIFGRKVPRYSRKCLNCNKIRRDLVEHTNHRVKMGPSCGSQIAGIRL